MSVLIRIGQNRKAIFRDGVWRCSDLAIERRLNAATAAWIDSTGGPPLNAGDPEFAAALEIIRLEAARIDLHVPANVRLTRLFFNRRQLRLDFGGSHE